jgi:hypothetical protein
MQLDPSEHRGPSAEGARVLVVVDWKLDAAALAAVLERDVGRRGTVGLLVPAWLHGLDWVGDPSASFPCAERQLGTLARYLREAGVPIAYAAVGDPDSVTAIDDAVADWPADGILLFPPQRRLVAPAALSLARRVERATGLPAARSSVARGPATARRGSWRRGGHCAAAQPQAAGSAR